MVSGGRKNIDDAALYHGSQSERGENALYTLNDLSLSLSLSKIKSKYHHKELKLHWTHHPKKLCNARSG